MSAPSPHEPQLRREQRRRTAMLLKRPLTHVVAALSELDLNDSAVLLGTFHVERLAVRPSHVESEAQEEEWCIRRGLALCALGDALKKDGQIKRARGVYDQAVALMGSAPPSRTSEPPSTPSRADWRRLSPGVAHTASSLRSELVLRAAQCRTAGMESSQALEHERMGLTAGGHVLLGKLKRAEGARHAAVQLEYRRALEKEPWALEAALALIELEVNPDEIMDIMGFNDLPFDSDPESAAWESQTMWIKDWLHAHAAAASYRPIEALRAFRRLASTPGFRDDAHVLVQIAKLELSRGNRDASEQQFHLAQLVDPYNPDGSDVYASLLRANMDEKSLSALTHRLLDAVGHKRPEAWIAAGLLEELRGNYDRALNCVTRAEELNPNHLAAHQYKGALLLYLQDPIKSLQSHLKAFRIKRDLNSYKGIVFAYLKMSPPRVMDALHVAKRALEAMKDDPRASILAGRVFAAIPNEDEKAVFAYTRALRLDPGNHEAACCLADVSLSKLTAATKVSGNFAPGMRNRLMQAARVLTQAIELRPKEILFTKLGWVHCALGDLSNGVAAFHHALVLNPLSADAKAGLDALSEAGDSATNHARSRNHFESDSRMEEDVEEEDSREFSPQRRTSRH